MFKIFRLNSDEKRNTRYHKEVLEEESEPRKSEFAKRFTVAIRSGFLETFLQQVYTQVDLRYGRRQLILMNIITWI